MFVVLDFTSVNSLFTHCNHNCSKPRVSMVFGCMLKQSKNHDLDNSLIFVNVATKFMLFCTRIDHLEQVLKLR
jgi:hypothetical protein